MSFQRPFLRAQLPLPPRLDPGRRHRGCQSSLLFDLDQVGATYIILKQCAQLSVWLLVS